MITFAIEKETKRQQLLSPTATRSSRNKMTKFYVRAEITGEFVTKENFNTKGEATAYYNARVEDSIYDNVDIWEA